MAVDAGPPYPLRRRRRIHPPRRPASLRQEHRHLSARTSHSQRNPRSRLHQAAREQARFGCGRPPKPSRTRSCCAASACEGGDRQQHSADTWSRWGASTSWRRPIKREPSSGAATCGSGDGGCWIVRCVCGCTCVSCGAMGGDRPCKAAPSSGEGRCGVARGVCRNGGECACAVEQGDHQQR